jgi:hypothetical protein
VLQFGPEHLEAHQLENQYDQLRRVDLGTFVTDGGDSHDMEVADIDGDGDLDILVANYGGANAIYINGGGGMLRKVTGPQGTGVAFVTAGDSSSSEDVEVADIDGDGDVDVLVANGYGENNAIYINDGGGGLQKLMQGAFVTDGGWSSDLEVADIDDDGDLDILVANGYDENNTMFINEGGGELRKETGGDFVTDVETRHKDMEVVDIDGDSDLDVLFAEYRTGDYKAMYINDGAGELRKLSSDGDVGVFRGMFSCFSSDMEVADIDADGDLDVLLATENCENAMYLNDGNGELRKVTESDFVGDFGVSTALKVADIDGDGDLDVLVANDPLPDRKMVEMAWSYDYTGDGNDAMYINEGGGKLRQVGAFLNTDTTMGHEPQA